jgi:hypothetical protein
MIFQGGGGLFQRAAAWSLNIKKLSRKNQRHDHLMELKSR